MLKGEFHVRMNTADRFSQMLVDLNRFLRPRLYLMDGIIAMEGNGPRNGDPRQMSVLLFSDDPVALDATVCRMIALDRTLVPTITWGDAWGLGTATQIEYLGDPVDSFLTPDFVVDRTPGSTTGEPGRFSRLTKNLCGAAPGDRPAALHHLRHLRARLPGAAESRGFRRRTRGRRRHATRARLQALHPLLLLPGDVPRARHRHRQTAARADHPPVEMATRARRSASSAAMPGPPTRCAAAP